MQVLQSGFLANAPGEPGCSNEISSALPIPVSSEVQLARLHPGGWGFALASTADGQLYAWGVNQATLLRKSGSADDGADPSTLDAIAANVDAAAGGFDHALVVQQGKLWVFGPHFNDPAGGAALYLSPIAMPVSVASVAAGEHHSMVLTAGGDVYTFGANREGQLGVDTGGKDAAEPVPVLGPGRGNSGAVTAIAAGARHSAAVDADGRCFAWGWSLHGQCGTGAAVPSVAAPTAVAALGPLRVASVAAGMTHTLCCTEDGDIYSWGGNADGQLGDGTRVAAETPRLLEHAALEEEHVVKVAAGARHSVALCRSGAAFAWGFGKFGQLGSGRHDDAVEPTAMVVPPGTKVADIAAGWWHTLLAVE